LRKIGLGQTITVLANIGVIAGIIFLALELQQNNELLRAEAANIRLQNQIGPRILILENPDLAELMAKHSSGKPLTATEEIKTNLFVQSIFLMFEWELNEYRAGRIELLKTAEHRRLFHGQGVISAPWYLTNWSKFKTVLEPEFVQYMEENVISQLE
jgi:hypothetical protein